MKLPKAEEAADKIRGIENKRITHQRSRNSDHVTEMLKLCLQKICEMQAELENEDPEEHDPEAAGYTACALETLKFLSDHGLAHDHPIVKGITEKLFKDKV